MILGQISVLTWRILTLKSGKGVPAGHLFHQMCILRQTRWQLEHVIGQYLMLHVLFFDCCCCTLLDVGRWEVGSGY